PGQDQAEYRSGCKAGDNLRKTNLEKHPHIRGAVDSRRILDVRRELVEEALHHPDRERQIESRIESNDPGIGARKAGNAEHDENRDDHHDRRQHAGSENDEQIGIVALERITREAERGERADDESEEYARSGDEQRVEEVEAESG